ILQAPRAAPRPIWRARPAKSARFAPENACHPTSLPKTNSCPVSKRNPRAHKNDGYRFRSTHPTASSVVGDFQSPIHQVETTAPLDWTTASGGRGMVLSFETARGRVIVGLVSLVMLMLPAPLMAAGAFAMGKCGAYGQAYDYQSEAA